MNPRPRRNSPDGRRLTIDIDTMSRFSEGDRVLIDIPDETDLGYDRLHGWHTTAMTVLPESGLERSALAQPLREGKGWIIGFYRYLLRK